MRCARRSFPSRRVDRDDWRDLARVSDQHKPRRHLAQEHEVGPRHLPRFFDDDDIELPPGEVGEICLRANVPWISAQGYYNMPEATLKSYRNLWFHTGDRGYFDADGYLYFADRKKDAIRRRGENISSWEVEQIIARHPAVEEVAVYGVRAEMSEDEVMASIVLRPGSTLDHAGLIRFCQDNMAYFMVPRFLETLAEMPKTMTQKVQKFKLREQGITTDTWDRDAAGYKVARPAPRGQK